MDEQRLNAVKQAFQLTDLEWKRAVAMAEERKAADIGEACGYVKASRSQVPRGRPKLDELARLHARNLDMGGRIASDVYASNPTIAHAVASAGDTGPRASL